MTFQPTFESISQITEPNQEIELYSGAMEVRQNQLLATGKGRVFLAWFPFPRIKFEISAPSDQSPEERYKELRQKYPYSKFQNINNPDPLKVIPLDQRFFKADKALIYLVELKHQLEINITRTSTQKGCRNIEGWIPDYSFGAERSLKYLTFHLTNFSLSVNRDYINTKKSIEFQIDHWKIIIESSSCLGEQIKSLGRQGGFLITHFVKVEKLDQTLFNYSDAKDFLEGIQYLFSFCAAMWVSPLLLEGFDQNNQKVFFKHEECLATDWQEMSTFNWFFHASNNFFPEFYSDLINFSKIACVFFREWSSEIWNNPIKRVIHRYIESNNRAVSCESSTILLQSTLELLYWVTLKKELELKFQKNPKWYLESNEERVLKKSFQGLKVIAEKTFKDTTPDISKGIQIILKKFEENEFEKKDRDDCRMNISERIAELLEFWKISLKFSTKLPELNKIFPESLVQAFCNIRNSTVHGALKNQKRFQEFPDKAFMEAERFGLFCIESILLKLFEYQGNYFNRITEKNEYF